MPPYRRHLQSPHAGDPALPGPVYTRCQMHRSLKPPLFYSVKSIQSTPLTHELPTDAAAAAVAAAALHPMLPAEPATVPKPADASRSLLQWGWGGSGSMSQAQAQAQAQSFGGGWGGGSGAQGEWHFIRLKCG